MPIVGFRHLVERALPGTISELAARSGMREPVVRHWIHVMRREGACHIGDWRRLDASRRGVNRYVAEYVPGAGVDALQIDSTRNLNIQVVLDAMPATRREIEIKTGLSKNTVFRIVRDLHDERCRWVRVCGWARPSKGPYMPRYSATKGDDVPCDLVRLTEAEKSRRHQAKARADGRWEQRKRRENAKYWGKKAGQRGDPMVNALFGRGNISDESDTASEGDVALQVGAAVG